MPTFHVTAPDGRKLSIQGDAAPSEAELDDIFKNMPPATQQQSAQPPSMSMPSLSTQDMAAGAAGLAGAVGANAVPAVNAAARYVAGSPTAQRVIGTGLVSAVRGGIPSGVVDLAMDAAIGTNLKDAIGKAAGKVASATANNPASKAFTMQEAINAGRATATKAAVESAPSAFPKSWEPFIDKAELAKRVSVGRDAVTGQFTKLSAAEKAATTEKVATKLLPSAFKQVLSKLGPAMGMMSGESAALDQLNDPSKVKAFIAKLSPEEKAKLFRQMPASFAKEYQD